MTSQSTVTLSRKVQFQCLHKYELKNFSEQQNQETFGACYTEYGHGHTYSLVGYFNGPIDAETGMIINLKDVDDLLKSAVQPLAGKHLNFEVSEFKEAVPTTENVLLWLAKDLQKKVKSFPSVTLSRLRLYETDNLWVDWVSNE